MTDDIDNQSKTLTLTSNKLTLNRKIDSNQMKKTFLNSNRNTVVEVKKSRLTLISSTKEKIEELKTNDELSKRLSLLKKVASDANEAKESDKANVILSRVEAINQFNAQNNIVEPGHIEVQGENQIIEPKKNTKEISIKDASAKLLNTKSNDSEFSEEGKSNNKGQDIKNITLKEKVETPRKLNKTAIFHMLDSDSDESLLKVRSLSSIKRAREKEKRKLNSQKQEKIYREVIIPEVITVGELASRMSERGGDVIKELMKLGMIATTDKLIDADTAELIVTSFGHQVKRVMDSDVENILDVSHNKYKDLRFRAPVVTVMGHVDHGKTSLLDALKSTDIVSKEAGGITQHIGAHRVTLKNGKTITFIDTPGHEAFTEMRTRGAKITDIIVLVVAADDGIKLQTIEAINHAKAAKVPIIVAVNKIDKSDINIDRVKNELLSHELVAEDLGGDTMIVPISALKRLNIDKLEESILLQAEMMDLKSDYNVDATGIIIESRVDRNQGVVATALVQHGVLKTGVIIVAGSSIGRIKKINDDKLNVIKQSYPSEPVEIYGLDKAPAAGDRFNVVSTEKQAREIANYRLRKAKDIKDAAVKITSLEEMFLKAANSGGVKELPIIIKGDVHGSVEAINNSLMKLVHDEVRVKILHSGVGGITESDIALANSTSALIVGFNVRTNNKLKISNEKTKADIRYYSVIYDVVDDVKLILTGMLTPIIHEKYLGSAEIREVFNITKIGKVAGCYVTKGIIKRGSGVRLLRDNVVIHEGKLKTLKRFKEEVKEVKDNYECGIAFEYYSDLRVGDQIEAFELIEEKKLL